MSSLVTVVIATRDRSDQLLASLHHLLDGRSPVERPGVVVVDNASSDGTVAAARAQHPRVQVVALDRNEGAVARNIGAATASTPYVAFNDDDSSWAPGSLRLVAERFDRHRDLALVAARVLVGDAERLDPVSTTMARSPLAETDRHPGLPGRPVLGFLACSAAARRSAFLAVGGFSRTLFFAGEEELLALDLAAAGWAVRYLDDLVVHHRPSPAGRVPGQRMVQQRRNALLTIWLRRPAAIAVRATATLARDACSDPVARATLASAASMALRVRRERHVLPPEVEADVRRLERDAATPPPTNPKGNR